MAVTLKEVAARAGVSRSAVSRTFTPGASVSARMRTKVEAAAQELGYFPNALASSLTTGRTKLIGLVSNNFHNPVFLEIFDRFTRGLQETGLRPLLVNLSDGTPPDASVRMLRQYSVDGVILASSTLAPDFVQAFTSAGVPVVHAFGRAHPAPVVDVVTIDNMACGRMAAATLLARGYRRLAFLGGPQAATTTQDRLAGFRAVLDSTPGVEVSHSFASDYTFYAGREAMMRCLGFPPAEAYFCGDDVLSIGALSAIQERGLSVPGDIGLLGLNDMEIAGWPLIDLTTIRQPVREIVQAAIDLMAEKLSEPDHAPRSQVLPCTVIERGTLRPLP